MHTIDLIAPPELSGPGGVHDFAFAGSWDELTELQLGQVAIELLSGYDPTALKFRLLRLLADIPKKLFKRIDHSDLIIATPDGAKVLPELDWIIAPPLFEKSLFPRVRIGDAWWQGPKDALGNFTVLQLSFCDICLERVIQESTSEALNNLLGALYHPEGSSWNNAGIEQRGSSLSKLPIHRKLAALLNYRGLRACLPKMYPRTFQGADSKDNYGIDGLLEGLAGPKFGHVDQVGEKPLHPALVHCERTLDRAAELKRKAEEAKRQKR